MLHYSRDCRVKPGNDEVGKRATAIGAMATIAP
jgi:hypothetical protein